MTKSQAFGTKNFLGYFPAWQAAAKAQGWNTKDGRANWQFNRLCPEAHQAFIIAKQRASSSSSSSSSSSIPSLDDLRHGCHWVALKRDKSHRDLTNPDIDRVVTFFRVLADPDNLKARMRWDAYARGENPGAAERTEWFISHAMGEPYAAAVSENKFGTRNWKNLNNHQKAQLARTLSQAKRRRRDRAVNATLETAGIEQPF